jgi:hypothetical protein
MHSSLPGRTISTREGVVRQARIGLLLLLGVTLPAGLRAQPQVRYTNAELVSVDTQARRVVIKDTEGKQRRLDLDDTVAGLDGLRAGDRVILALREEPGTTRVSSIVKSKASATGSSPAVAAPVEQPTTVAPAALAFAEQVSALAEQAGQVDALWSNFVTSCNVTLRASYPDGRDWFSLWESGAAQMDLSNGACRDIFNQLVARGEAVKTRMVAAQDAARKADVAPGDTRETLRRYSMQWGGFGLPAPDPLKQ